MLNTAPEGGTGEALRASRSQHGSPCPLSRGKAGRAGCREWVRLKPCGSVARAPGKRGLLKDLLPMGGGV